MHLELKSIYTKNSIKSNFIKSIIYNYYSKILNINVIR